jgi:hypothetical protein
MAEYTGEPYEKDNQFDVKKINIFSSLPYGKRNV